MQHHDLDIHPIPRDKQPLYINEPCLADSSIFEQQGGTGKKEPENQPDNIRIYVPIDLNKESILRRLDWLIQRYKEANEQNENDYSADVNQLISQIEIYDQVWSVRHVPVSGNHSCEAKELVTAFIEHLEQIPDGCAEMFPFTTIEQLRSEYLSLSPPG